MSCRSPCYSPDGQYMFTFVNENKNRVGADDGCKKLNKTLANNLSQDDYCLINNCCDFEGSYRIGLVSEDKYCKNNKSTPYYWFGNNSNCVDGSPLDRHSSPTKGCYTVTLIVSNGSNNILKSNWSQCNKTMPYICQEKRNTTMSLQATITSVNSAVIAGAIAGILFIILLLLLFLIFRRSKKYEAVKQGFRRRASSYFTKSEKTNESHVGSHAANDAHYNVMPSERSYDPRNVSQDSFSSHDFVETNHHDANPYHFASDQPTYDSNPYAVVNENHLTRQDFNPETTTDEYAVVDVSVADQENVSTYDLENQSNPDQFNPVQADSPTHDAETTAVYAVVNKPNKKATAKTIKNRNENETTDVYAAINKTRKK